MVGVLAVDDREQVLLLHRHRFITDRGGWDLPAGAAEPGEAPAAAAAWELAEETGLSCEHLEPLARAGGRSDVGPGLRQRQRQVSEFAGKHCRRVGIAVARRADSP